MKKYLNNIFKKRSIMIYFLISSFIIPLTILAETMQSGTYKIESDSINVGGQDSSSSNYRLRDTAGEAGTGDSNSGTYALRAGFWQLQDSYIALSTPSDLALTPIGGINGEASEGTIFWQVTTDNIAGYSMSIASTTTPALKSGSDSFDDYTPAGANPDYNFSILSTTSAFGFSPEGTDVSVRFKDNSSVCNVDTTETTAKCWDGLSTTPKTIFQRGTSNQPTGTTATVRFRAESGPDHIQPAGSYSAPITITAITL